MRFVRFIAILGFLFACFARTAKAQTSSPDLRAMWGAPATALRRPAPRRDSTVAAPARADSAARRAVAGDTVVPQSVAAEIAALRARVDSLTAARNLAVTLSARVDSLAAAARTAQQQAAAQQQTMLQRIAGLGNFRFAGDVRARYETMAQDAGFITRQRERLRARFGVTGSIGDDISGGIGISTGALDDNQSTNQTATGFFARKAIGFDRFYVTYHPHQVRQLTVMAGKFAWPFYRTSLTFGNDIFPEGIASSLSFSFGRKAALQNVSLVGYAMPLFEVPGGNDSYVLGGQLQTRWRVTSRLGVRLYATGVAFDHPDAVAVAVAAGTIKPASSTNTMKTDSTGKVIGYATGFFYANAIGAVDYAFSARWPVSLQLDMTSNRRATARRQAWQFDARFGRGAEKHDLAIGYTHFHVERDAVLSAFVEQDLRAATNVVQHKFAVSWLWQRNVTLQATAWLGHLLEPTQNASLVTSGNRPACTTAPFSGCVDSTLRRFQFDIIYKL